MYFLEVQFLFHMYFLIDLPSSYEEFNIAKALVNRRRRAEDIKPSRNSLSCARVRNVRYQCERLSRCFNLPRTLSPFLVPMDFNGCGSYGIVAITKEIPELNVNAIRISNDVLRSTLILLLRESV